MGRAGAQYLQLGLELVSVKKELGSLEVKPRLLLDLRPLLGQGKGEAQGGRAQALMAFQRSLSVLLMLPTWQGMEATSSK